MSDGLSGNIYTLSGIFSIGPFLLIPHSDFSGDGFYIHKNLGSLIFDLSSEILYELALGRAQMAHHLNMHAWPDPVTEVKNHRAPCWAMAPGQPHREPQAEMLALDTLLTP